MASAKKFLGRGRYRPRPKIPRIPGRPKENSNYCKCAHEICLTAGVHPTILCTSCVQEGGFEGPENGPKQRRINNRLLSYRPIVPHNVANTPKQLKNSTMARRELHNHAPTLFARSATPTARIPRLVSARCLPATP